MIDLCERAGLSSPMFRQEGGQFVQVLWRPEQGGTRMDLDQESVEILRACMTEKSMIELLTVVGREKPHQVQ
ncbi:hypothetical protein RJ40_00715 [Methanofollis aquaemaris]|uniref:Uncharacterized protein n=1 Tax=Methanofollis aquaemaris TaxID=126734 RepID=A0A8A3S1B4_9EURY|nr:hypothetical protein [Methanofollis aquaemaris]QSZ66125.1 hypothetical protein RJ40_00715 [Methanofollis aquaemaris]